MSPSLNIEVNVSGVAHMRNAFFGGLWFKKLTVECIPPNALVEDQCDHVVRLLENIRLVLEDNEPGNEDKLRVAEEEWKEMLGRVRKADLRRPFRFEKTITVCITPVIC